MKEVARHEDKFHIFAYRISPKNIDPRLVKVTRTLGQLVSSASQVHIGDMEKPHS